METKVCCVTGHRDIPTDRAVYVEQALRREVLAAIEDGYTRFISGFAEGTDLMFGNVKKCAVGKHPKSEKLGSTGQAACCARIHSRYFTGGSPSGLRV